MSDGACQGLVLELRAARRFKRRTTLTLRRAGFVGMGTAFMVAGIASIPTPIPIGLVLFAVGLYFIARGSKLAGRGIKLARRRLPMLSRGLNALKPRLPAPMRRFIEKSDPGV